MIWRRLHAWVRGDRFRYDPHFRAVEARTKDLEVRAHELLGGLTAGYWASLFRGSGMEPDGVRPYQDGDGVRAVDWRVTARKGSLHVREFVDERGMEVLLIIDRSASLRLTSGPAGRLAVEAAAALALASNRSGHRVGLMQVTDQVEKFVRPRSGDVHLRRILWEMAALEPQRMGTDLPSALHAAASVLPTGSLFIVVSDFRCPVSVRQALTPAVARLSAHGSLLAVRVASPGLLDLPDVGVLEVVDPATGSMATYDSGSEEERARLLSRERVWAEWWGDLCRVAGGPHLTVDVQQPLDVQLRRGLAAVGRRVA